MGATQAMGWAEMADDGVIDLTRAVGYHLSTNFYPPHPVDFTETAMEAIEAFNDEDTDRLIQLPEGVSDRVSNSTQMPAWRVVDNLRLEYFIGVGVEVEL